MQPSNPVTFFVSDSDEEDFTYQPGSTPHYVIIREKGCIWLSAMVFADDEAHVRQIITDMVAFWKQCNEQYVKTKGDEPSWFGRPESLEAALQGNKKYFVHIGPAKTNQLYKIGWASNDTI